MKIPPDLPTTLVTAPKTDTSVRPKEQRQKQPPQDPSPDPPPPSPVIKTSKNCHRDDEGWDRLMDRTVVDPTFAYAYSGREEIGQEIKRNRIKWLMTKAEHHNITHTPHGM